jgi:L-malate glycosyltransferase
MSIELLQESQRANSVPLMLNVLRIPESVHYRAYAESVGQGSVLAWALRRLMALIPQRTPVVFVCESESERTRLTAAMDGISGVRLALLPGRSEIQRCRYVLDEYQATQLLVAGLSHAAAPERMLRDLYQMHVLAGAGITEAVGGTFADPCYAIDARIVELLLTTSLQIPASATLRAATQLREEAAVRGEKARFFWLRADVGNRYGLPPEKWPESIGIISEWDVETVRQVLEATPEADEQGGLVRRWKRASIRTRQRRLGGNGQRITVAPRPTRGRIRVLYACHMSAFTGAQQSLCHLIQALDRTRYEPCAVISYEGTFSSELRRRGVEVICPNHPIVKNDPENLKLARHLLGLFRPDLIHANHVIGMPLISAATAEGVPLIQHVRIPDLATLAEHIAAADAAIAVSHFIGQKVQAMDVEPERVHVIWNGVLSQEFSPRPEAKAPSRALLGLPSDEFVIAMIARLSRTKRHETVLAALSHLRRAIGRGRLLLVGEYDGDLPYVQELEALIAKEGLAPFIKRIEFLSDIRPVLHASDTLVLPSEDEPLGRAVLEGMAVGLPVIVADSGGSKEVVDAGRTGFVIPCGNVSQLGQILVELAQKPEWARQIGMAAALKVQTSLTANACAAKTVEIYEQVLGGTRRRCA